MSTVITESYQGLLWNGRFVATVVLRLKQQNFKARLKDLKDLLVCVNEMKPCYHGAPSTSHENLAVLIRRGKVILRALHSTNSSVLRS